MRLSILSSKGGVGKSTLAISLSKELARRRTDVLLIDRDLIGYASYLAGIRGPGLVTSVVEELDTKPWREIKVESGSVTILKYFGDGPRYKLDIEKLHRQRKLGERGWELYRGLLKAKRYSFVIVDNAALVRPEDDIVKHELDTFKGIYPDMPIWQIFVSDFLDVDIKETVRYANLIGSVELGSVLAFVINMVYPEISTRVNHLLDQIVNALKARMGLTIPFSEKVYQYNGDFESFPILPEVGKMATKIMEMM
ncbi:MAG: P-loop NTPase [Metallosphaera sp.]